MEFKATFWRAGGLIRLLTSALTILLYQRIALLHQAPWWLDVDGLERRHLSWKRGIPGNHDHGAPGTVWHRDDFQRYWKEMGLNLQALLQQCNHFDEYVQFTAYWPIEKT